MDNLIGRVLGNRYELVEKVGGGGMAIVYKAKCKLLNRFVAVKILRTDSDMTDDFIKRFKVEAQAAGSLSHPNIVSIYDVGNEGDVNYIVMEYVEGYTLKEVISQSGKLTWRATVKIASQICAGLEHAHKNHIIHRDIKSQNILVNEELVAKVTDFGIARASTNSTITMTGNTIGSVHYFSPEQAKGQHTDEKSDIYSLGIVMYEMITGRVPFDADTPVSVALKQIQEIPIQPMQYDKEMPIAVNDIIMKALQKEPRLRYQSATEMLKDLQAVLENPQSTVVSDKNIGATTVMPSVTENMINERAIKPVKTEENMGRKKKKSSETMSVLAFIVALFIVTVIAFLLASFVINSARNPEYNFFTEKAEVEMPNLVGKNLQEAKALLEEKNIVIDSIIEQPHDTKSKGTVTSQQPSAGIKVKEGVKNAKLWVSTGKAEIDIPDVSNLSLELAKDALDKENILYTVTEEASDTIPVGYVIRTDPAGGRAISASKIIDLYVSRGPDVKTFVMPYLIGKTLDYAKTKSTELNFKITTKFETSTRTPNTVLSQSIEAGKETEEGTEVILTIAKQQSTTVSQPGNKQTVWINLSNKGTPGVPFSVEVEISSLNTGTKKIYSEQHTSDDGEISVDVTGYGEIMLKVYIDGKLDSSQALNLGTNSPRT